ncbi:MAG: hypothetical protein ACHQ02_06065, partial [Candidatus Limnocylindrales bacterium]
VEEDAVQVDAYLDQLLAARGTGEPRSLPLHADEALDAELEGAARAVRRTLQRFHPSFRIEELLAHRLSGLEPGPSVMTEPITVAAFAVAPGADGAATERLADGAGLELRGRGGILLGGAIASGVSIAGAAVLAWRRARSEHRWERLA